LSFWEKGHRKKDKQEVNKRKTRQLHQGFQEWGASKETGFQEDVNWGNRKKKNQVLSDGEKKVWKR